MKIKKSECALFQLVDAVRLFNEKRFISAITLAGAANEIFEMLNILNLKRCSISIPEDEWLKTGQDLRSETIKVKKGARGSLIKDIQNKVKNEIKHHNDAKDYEIEVDFGFEAQMKITDAITNYKFLFETYPDDFSVKQFIQANFKI